MIWERATGRPIHPAIVWQDRRTAAACAALVAAGHEPLVRARTGLELDATFPASKIRWLLEHVPGAARAAEAGELAYGDVASWLAYSLTGGERHATDAGNAGRTMLCALAGTGWDAELLDLFGVPASLLPPIARLRRRRSAARPDGAADRRRARRPAGVALRAALLRARRRRRSRSAPAASCSCRPAASRRRRPTACSPSPAWRREGVTSYALEGFVPVAGAAIDWLVEIGVLDDGRLARRAASRRPRRTSSTSSSCRRCRVSGRRAGAPRRAARSSGSSRGRRRAPRSRRATVDGVLHQIADGVDAIARETADRGDQARRRSLPQRLRRAAARRPDGSADRARRTLRLDGRRRSARRRAAPPGSGGNRRRCRPPARPASRAAALRRAARGARATASPR